MAAVELLFSTLRRHRRGLRHHWGRLHQSLAQYRHWLKEEQVQLLCHACRLRQSLAQYRHWLEEERKVSSDPVKHQEFLSAFRQSWSSSALGSIDMSILSRMADPQMVAQAQKDPEFYKVGVLPLS